MAEEAQANYVLMSPLEMKNWKWPCRLALSPDSHARLLPSLPAELHCHEETLFPCIANTKHQPLIEQTVGGASAGHFQSSNRNPAGKSSLNQ